MNISVAICIYNDFDFFSESIDRIYNFADEIVILDGPYGYCIPLLKLLDLFYEKMPPALETVVKKPKVRYEYRLFENEQAKRIALYEMCRGDIVMLLDFDELVTTIHHEDIDAFMDSDKSVGSACFQNHVRSNIVSVEDTRKMIFFKRSTISALQHLNFTWLVGINQEKPDLNIVFQKPLVDVAHLTLMRSPYHSTVKYCFYTRLFYYSKGPLNQINRLFGKPFDDISALNISITDLEIYLRRTKSRTR